MADVHALAENWDPQDRPLHCSNCLHCKVKGPPARPLVFCEMGQSVRATLPYHSVMRKKHPMAFKSVLQCPFWSCMNDE